MADYRYMFHDLLTNRPNIELPLYGTSYGRLINKAGNFNGSWALDRENFNNQDVIDGTIPGRTRMYIERDGKLVWGGVIWSRTWQEQSKSFQYSGQSFESWFAKQDIRRTLAFSSYDQRNVMIELIRDMQQDSFANLSITLPEPFTNGGISRSVTFHDYEVWTYGKAIDYMIDYDEGFDYTLDVRYSTDGDPEIVLLTNNILGTPLANSQLVFDYPGAIKNFWYPENAAKGATDIHGVGKGEGSAMVRSRVSNVALLATGHPRLVEIYENDGIANVDTMNSHIVAELQRLGTPVTVPTFHVNPASAPVFGTYQLGDYAKMVIDKSPRFPEGKELFTRIIGWNVTPTSSEGMETVGLVAAGEEEAA